MGDLILFLWMLVCHAVSFLLLSSLVFFVIKKNALSAFLGTIMISVAVVSLLSHYFLSSQFSTPGSFVVSMAGSALCCFFAAWLYLFLGPFTADRSITVHMMMLLAKTDGGVSLDKLADRFTSRAVIEKRLSECAQAKMITEKDGTYRLTEKGRSIAKMYTAFLDLLRIRERSDFKKYFRET